MWGVLVGWGDTRILLFFDRTSIPNIESTFESDSESANNDRKFFGVFTHPPPFWRFFWSFLYFRNKDSLTFYVTVALAARGPCPKGGVQLGGISQHLVFQPVLSSSKSPQNGILGRFFFWATVFGPAL